jgi:hypothetical protein
MTKEKKDSALVFVGQIMTAYKAAMRVEGEALKAAIECGKYLNLAKENVKADKGKWLPWLKQNCPEISQQTASLYMRLADPENLDKLVGVKTIRDADKALRQPRDDDQDDQDETDDDDDDKDAEVADDKTNNALLVGNGSPDLVVLLKNVGADEVVKALHDAEWARDDIEKLVSLLKATLDATPAASAEVPAPSSFKRLFPKPLNTQN